MLPLDFFPYVLPIPGIVAGPLNIICGAIKEVKGTSKVIEGVKGDFEGNDNLKVEINGGIEAIKGVGSIITTGALIAGASSIALPAAAAVLGVTAGKTLYDVGSALYNQRRISKMTVRQKLKEVDEDQKAA